MIQEMKMNHYSALICGQSHHKFIGNTLVAESYKLSGLLGTKKLNSFFFFMTMWDYKNCSTNLVTISTAAHTCTLPSSYNEQQSAFAHGPGTKTNDTYAQHQHKIHFIISSQTE